jgi:hypothetical protein
VLGYLIVIAKPQQKNQMNVVRQRSLPEDVQQDREAAVEVQGHGFGIV